MYYKGLHVKKVYETENGKTLYRLSNWTRIHNAYNVRANNSQLGYYRTDENGYREGQTAFNPANGTYCDYFVYNGRKYALNRFVCMGSVWCAGAPYGIKEKDGVHFVSSVDFDGDLYNPLLIEIDEYGENVRVFLEA